MLTPKAASCKVVKRKIPKKKKRRSPPRDMFDVTALEELERKEHSSSDDDAVEMPNMPEGESVRLEKKRGTSFH